MREIKSAIVMGATGAVGTALIRELISHDVSITAVCRPTSERLEAVPEHRLVTAVKCDLNELSRLPELAGTKADVFYHLGWANTFGAAARNDMAVQVKNIQYTLDAVHAAAAMGCQTFIGTGSQAEYGRVNELLRPDTPCFPENGYGMAKLCAGEMSRIECEKLGIRHIWCRILSVYGPGDGKETLVMSVLRQLLAGEKPACTAGDQMWDYLYSGDAAHALYLMALRGNDGAVYPLGSGIVKPLKEYILAMRDSVNPNLPVGLGELPYSEKQVMFLGTDLATLYSDLDFEPEFSFDVGIKNTIDYIRGIEI